MSSPSVVLQGFAYGEHLEGVPQRSLGYRLLAPVEPQPWAAEVETLARHLQATHYPDDWPQTDLFCSVLLADGQRLIAVVRYGLIDHTAAGRRGGLELLGVLGPGSLGVPSTLAIYHWLRERRAKTDDPRDITGEYPLAEILSTVSVLPDHSEPPAPSLPVPKLFAAMAPSDPDKRLELLHDLESGGGPPSAAWQWLPLVGADFPLSTYAQRGPLIAWSPPAIGRATVGAGPSAGPHVAHDDGSTPSAKRRRVFQAVLGLIIALLLGANLWTELATNRQAQDAQREAPSAESEAPRSSRSALGADASREQLAKALYQLLQKQHATGEWTQNQLIDHYQTVMAADDHLRMESSEGKALVGAVSLLARRDAGRIETAVREALTNKGYDPELINLACRRIHEHLTADLHETP